MYVKNDIKVLKILKWTFLNKSPIKLEVFALSIQYILFLEEVEQYKT